MYVILSLWLACLKINHVLQKDALTRQQDTPSQKDSERIVFSVRMVQHQSDFDRLVVREAGMLRQNSQD
jgi:hypothetical protein